jgi:hypothetical protein
VFKIEDLKKRERLPISNASHEQKEELLGGSIPSHASML